MSYVGRHALVIVMNMAINKKRKLPSSDASVLVKHDIRVTESINSLSQTRRRAITLPKGSASSPPTFHFIPTSLSIELYRTWGTEELSQNRDTSMMADLIMGAHPS